MHNTDVVREGMGRRVQEADGHLDALLDRAPSERAAAVAGQGPHPDGVAAVALQFHVLNPPDGCGEVTFVLLSFFSFLF